MDAKLDYDNKGVMTRVLDHPFFSGMSANERALIAMAIEPGVAREAEFKPGEIILREGEPAAHFYLIENGSIVLEAHEPADGNFLIEKLEAGNVLGFSWLFPPFTWDLQARSLETTKVIVLNAAHLLVTAEQNKAFGYHLMRRVGQIAIYRLDAARKQLVKASRQLQTLSRERTSK